MRAGWRSSCPPRWRTWRTGRTAATGCPARSGSPTAGTRSPPRRPPAPSATTSATTRRRGRWYIDASWKAAPVPAASLDDLRQRPVVAIDVNHGHLAAAVIAPDGNILGTPATIGLDLAGLPVRHPRRAPASRHHQPHRHRRGLRRPRHRHRGPRLRPGPRRRTRARRAAGLPAAGAARGFRRAVSGIPTGKLRDRLVQMAANAGLSVIVVDPAYTSRWAAQHWLAPLREHHPKATGHHAAALVIGRRGLGPPGQAPRDREPARPGGGGTASPGAAQDHPGGRDRTQETRHPTRPPAATRHQDQTASPDHGRQPGSPRPFGAAD